MPRYAYRAARADGSTFDGQIEGDDEQGVRSKLEAEGLLVFRLSRRGARSKLPALSLARWNSLPLQEFLIFNQELLALVKAGLKPEYAEVVMKPTTEIDLTGEDAQRMQKLLDALESLDDVQEVYTTAVLEPA